MHILLGALVGAVVGAVAAVVIAKATGRPVTWQSVAAGAVGGAVGGAITAATFGAGTGAGQAIGGSIASQLTGLAVAGGVGAGTQTATENVLTGQPVFDNVAESTAIGAVAGPLLGVAGKGVVAVGRRAVPMIGRALGGGNAGASPPLAARPSNTRGIIGAFDDGASSNGGGFKPGSGGGTPEPVKVAPTVASSIDPVTAQTMQRLGVDENTLVYRVMDPKYLDLDNGVVAGNPRSVARVRDPYNLVDHPWKEAILKEGGAPEGFSLTVPRSVNASELGPSLNVAVKDPSSYSEPGMVKIAIRLGDLLAAGGRIYPDEGAVAQGIKPLIVTFNGKVPFKVVPTTPRDGLPLDVSR